ncbi:PIPO, partial [Habenaria mosaic virus]
KNLHRGFGGLMARTAICGKVLYNVAKVEMAKAYYSRTQPRKCYLFQEGFRALQHRFAPCGEANSQDS